MGYLDNSSITVDAILTKKGRELLAQGRNQFNITRYALADDEVDYDLWNGTDSRGSSYFGAIIEAMPLTEALPDETQVMKYKLITLNNSSGNPVNQVPQLKATPSTFTDINLRSNIAGSITRTLTPTVDGFLNANNVLGYTVITNDSRYVTVKTTTAAGSTPTGSSAAVQFLGDSNSSLYNAQSNAVVGLKFDVTFISPSPVTSGEFRYYTTTIDVIGNETGGRVSIPVTITY